MTGTFILSLDCECAWGTEPNMYGVFASTFNRYEEINEELARVLTEHDVPATWAVVAHLLLPPSSPFAISRKPVAWYHAEKLLDIIRSGRTRHEIGSHTFSHLYAGNSAVTRADWEADLQRALEIHHSLGLQVRSLVYPRNQVAHTDLLERYGITSYRGAEKTWYADPSGMAHILDRTFAIAPPTYAPAACRVGSRLVNLPGSQFLLAYNGFRRFVPTAARVRQAQRGLARAVERGEIFHLWFHPFNLGTSPEMFIALCEILDEVVKLRDAGKLVVQTMEDAAESILRDCR